MKEMNMKNVLLFSLLLLASFADAGIFNSFAKDKAYPDNAKSAAEIHARHLSEIAKSGGSFDFVLIGDSVTYNWGLEEAKGKWGVRPLGKKVAEKEFAGKKWLNLGLGGDGIQHVIWRCQNGELDGYTTPVIGLLIGTNNHGNADDDIVSGIAYLLGVIRTKQPQAKILLQPVLPRLPKPNDEEDLRKKFDRVNLRLKAFADGKKIVWLDWTKRLLRPDGTVNEDLMLDEVHPAGGYAEWAKALKPYIR